MTKRLILLIVLTLSLNYMPVQANESVEVSYDLNEGGKKVFCIENSKGEVDKITIEQLNSNMKIANSNYRVTYEAVNWTAGFYITVLNNEITNAYSPFYSIARGEIRNSKLNINSNTKATFSFQHKVTIFTYNTGVIANINNNNLYVTKK